MPTDVAQHFMDALQETERSGEVDALVALFAEGASLRRMAQAEPYEGKDAARAFWRDYLSVFGEIETTFTNTIESEGHAVLEWMSSGSLAGGKSVRYEGASILEHDGERVKGFRTYYDSATFAQEASLS